MQVCQVNLREDTHACTHLQFTHTLTHCYKNTLLSLSLLEQAQTHTYTHGYKAIHFSRLIVHNVMLTHYVVDIHVFAGYLVRNCNITHHCYLWEACLHIFDEQCIFDTYCKYYPTRCHVVAFCIVYICLVDAHCHFTPSMYRVLMTKNNCG